MLQRVWRHRNSRRVLLEWAWAAVVLLVLAWVDHPIAPRQPDDAAVQPSEHVVGVADRHHDAVPTKASNDENAAGWHACNLALSHVESLLDACNSRPTAACPSAPPPAPPTGCPCMDGFVEMAVGGASRGVPPPPSPMDEPPTLEGAWDLVKAMLFGAASTLVCRLLVCRGGSGGNQATESDGAPWVGAVVGASEALGRREIADAHDEIVAGMAVSMRDAVLSLRHPNDAAMTPRRAEGGTAPHGDAVTPQRILANVSAALWAGNTPPTSSYRRDGAMQGASLAALSFASAQGPSTLNVLRTNRGTSPEAVLPLSFDATQSSPTMDKAVEHTTGAQRLGQAMLGALTAAWLSMVSELELHWYNRAEGIYLASQAACKWQLQAKRFADEKKRNADASARQLEAAEKAWAARVAEANRASEAHTMDLEARHAAYVEQSRLQLHAWADRYASLMSDRDALTAASMEAQTSLKALQLELSAAHDDGARLEAAVARLSAQATADEERRLSATSVGTQCAAPACMAQSTETSCTVCVAQGTQTETAQQQHHASQPASGSQSPSVVSPSAYGGGFSDALIRENREKHMARLEARLLELDHRHHYCVGWSASSTAGSEPSTPMDERPEGDRSRPPKAMRSAVTKQVDGYLSGGPRASPMALEGLHDALLLQHSGVSRRRSAPGSPVVPPGSMVDHDGRHPYAVADVSQGVGRQH